jgi:type IV pilus assembly protein PilC
MADTNDEFETMSAFRFEWDFRVFEVTGVEAGAKSHLVEVLSPFPEAAEYGVGALEEEIVVEKQIGVADRKFRMLVASRRVKAPELTLFYEGISRFVTLGLPPKDAVGFVVRQVKSPYFRGVLAGLNYLMSEGVSFVDALRRFPKVFPRAATAMLAAGLEAGDTAFHTALKNLAMGFGSSASIFKKIKGALIYPAVMTAGALVICMIIVTTVLPKLVSGFKSMNIEVPWYTRMAIDVGAFVRMHPFLVAVCVLGAGALLVSGVSALFRTVFMQRLCLKVPVVGLLLRKSIMARSLRAFAMLIGAGVSARVVFDIVDKVAGHPVYREYFQAVAARVVQEGQMLSKAFRAEFWRVRDGDLVAALVYSGEHSGKISPVLLRYSDDLDADVKSVVNVLPELVSPIAVMVPSSMVGLIVFLVFGPYFAMLQGMIDKL